MSSEISLKMGESIGQINVYIYDLGILYLRYT